MDEDVKRLISLLDKLLDTIYDSDNVTAIIQANNIYDLLNDKFSKYLD